MNTLRARFGSVTNQVLAMKFASEFILIYPLYTIMFRERGGVSAAGIGSILALGFVLAVVFEIPTGVLADRVPRKRVLLAGIVSKLIALMAFLTLPFYGGYVLGATFLALAVALESGALQAYLYETLGVQNQKNFGKYWARVGAMIMLSYTLAYVLASVIGVRYELLIGVSIAACVVALFLCSTLPLDALAHGQPQEKPRVLRSALRHIMHSKPLLALLINAVVIVSLAEVVIEYLSLYYNQVGIGTRYVPLLMALGNVIGGVLFWTLHSWEGILDRYKIGFTAMALLIFLGSFRGNLFVLCAGVLIFTRFLRVLQVQFESNIQHLSSNEARATISSIAAFVAKLTAAAIVVLIGLFAVENSIIRPLRIALISGTIVFILLQVVLNVRKNSSLADGHAAES